MPRWPPKNPIATVNVRGVKVLLLQFEINAQRIRYLANVRIATLHRDRAPFSSSISDGISRAYEVRVVHVSGGAAGFLNYKSRRITYAIIIEESSIFVTLLTHATGA